MKHHIRPPRWPHQHRSIGIDPCWPGSAHCLDSLALTGKCVIRKRSGWKCFLNATIVSTYFKGQCEKNFRLHWSQLFCVVVISLSTSAVYLSCECVIIYLSLLKWCEPLLCWDENISPHLLLRVWGCVAGDPPAKHNEREVFELQREQRHSHIPAPSLNEDVEEAINTNMK